MGDMARGRAHPRPLPAFPPRWVTDEAEVKVEMGAETEAEAEA